MFETSDPKQPFYVANKISLFPQAQRCLIKLYEPIIGGRAVALYLTLIQDYQPNAILSDSKGIYTLQEQIDCSLRKLFLSLHRLEAVGLIKTYLINNKVNKIIAFKMCEVMSAQEFFSTDLLASLLKDKVGPVAFKELSRFFAALNDAKEREIKNGQDVSATFFDAFNLSDAEAITPSRDVVEAAQDNQTRQAPTAQINDQIDWDFITDQFNLYQVAPGEVQKNKDQIRSLMQTYGLSASEFVTEALITLHGSSKLDMRAIANTLAEDYRLLKTRHQMEQELDQDKALRVPNDLPKGTEKLWQEANRLSPAEFLYKIKRQKGGFADAVEKKIVNNLHSLVGLPTDVVNILIYVCLKTAPSVSYKYANTTANDWLQHGVTNSASALKYLAKREQERQEKLKKRAERTKFGFKKQIEQGTDWSKKKARTDKKVNPEELKNFFKNFEDQNETK